MMPKRFREYENEPWHSRDLRLMLMDNYGILYIPIRKLLRLLLNTFILYVKIITVNDKLIWVIQANESISLHPQKLLPSWLQNE